jgi:thioredoxin reductase (NADPH)
LGQEKVEGLVLKTTSHEPRATSQLAVDGLFIAIGHSPNSKIVEGLVERDEKGYVKRDLRDGLTAATSAAGIFVAGDCSDQNYRQAVTAAGFGCQAALDVKRWLESQSS